VVRPHYENGATMELMFAWLDSLQEDKKPIEKKGRLKETTIEKV
jgi:hypothetical protein